MLGISRMRAEEAACSVAFQGKTLPMWLGSWIFVMQLEHPPDQRTVWSHLEGLCWAWWDSALNQIHGWKIHSWSGTTFTLKPLHIKPVTCDVLSRKSLNVIDCGRSRQSSSFHQKILNFKYFNSSLKSCSPLIHCFHFFIFEQFIMPTLAHTMTFWSTNCLSWVPQNKWKGGTHNKTNDVLH